MEKRKKGATVFTACMLAALIAVLLAAVLFACYIFTDGFGGKIPIMSVELNGQTYMKSKNGIQLSSGSVMKIESLSLKKDYQIQILAKAPEQETDNFGFTVADEQYYWSDEQGRDYTSAFQFTESGKDGIRITFGSIVSVLTAVYGTDPDGENRISVSEEITSENELFELVISAGQSTIRLGLRIEFEAIEDGNGDTGIGGVETDPDHIVV